MTDRRFRRSRRRRVEPMKVAAASAVVLGAVAVIGFDYFSRGGADRGATMASIDPLAGGAEAAVAAARPSAPRPAIVKASLLPGELIIEGTTPRIGEILLENHPIPAPPVVIDTLAPGTHALSVVAGDSVLWRTDVTLDAGGTAHVVVPEIADSSDSTR